jgi:hypothetical protein
MPPAAGRSDAAVAPPRLTIMPDIHRRVALLVTAVDELFGTHRVIAGHAFIDNIRRGH